MRHYPLTWVRIYTYTVCHHFHTLYCAGTHMIRSAYMQVTLLKCAHTLTKYTHKDTPLQIQREDKTTMISCTSTCLEFCFLTVNFSNDRCLKKTHYIYLEICGLTGCILFKDTWWWSCSPLASVTMFFFIEDWFIRLSENLIHVSVVFFPYFKLIVHLLV